jgi:ureidoglycolate lyase
VRVLEVRPLSARLFSGFGQVVEAGTGTGRLVNDGRALRYDVPAALEAEAGRTAPALAVYRVEAVDLPFAVGMFERHPLSSQLFVPMTVSRYLVVVAPPDARGLPDAGRAMAFAGSGGQGVTYARGVWHSPMVALDAPGDLAMVMWQAAEAGEDCEIHALAEPIIVR